MGRSPSQNEAELSRNLQNEVIKAQSSWRILVMRYEGGPYAECTHS